MADRADVAETLPVGMLLATETLSVGFFIRLYLKKITHY